MEIKTTKEIKNDITLQNNIKWVKVNDEIDKWQFFKDTYKDHLDDVEGLDYFIQSRIDELSQSNPKMCKHNDIKTKCGFCLNELTSQSNPILTNNKENVNMNNLINTDVNISPSNPILVGVGNDKLSNPLPDVTTTSSGRDTLKVECRSCKDITFEKVPLDISGDYSYCKKCDGWCTKAIICIDRS